MSGNRLSLVTQDARLRERVQAIVEPAGWELLPGGDVSEREPRVPVVQDRRGEDPFPAEPPRGVTPPVVYIVSSQTRLPPGTLPPVPHEWVFADRLEQELTWRLGRALERARHSQVGPRMSALARAVAPYLDPCDFCDHLGLALLAHPEVEGVQVHLCAGPEPGSLQTEEVSRWGNSAAVPTRHLRDVLAAGTARSLAGSAHRTLLLPLGPIPLGIVVLHLEDPCPGLEPWRTLADLASSYHTQSLVARDLSQRQLEGSRQRREQRRALEGLVEALERREASWSQVVRDLAHNLRNPLGILSGTVQLMEAGIPAPFPPEHGRHLESMRRQFHKVDRILAAVLEHGVEPGSALEVLPRPVPLREALALAMGIDPDGSGSENRNPEPIPRELRVQADPGVLHSCLRYLVGTATGGEPRLPGVELDSQRARIRFPRRRSPLPGGAAVPAPLRELARAGGVDLRDEDGAPVMELAVVPGAGERARILVVSADPQRRARLTPVLADHWEVQPVSGLEAIEGLSTETFPGLVVLDLVEPGETREGHRGGAQTGSPLLGGTRLLRDPRLRDVPVFGVVPPGREGLAQAALAIGVAVVLREPVNVNRLLLLAARALGEAPPSTPGRRAAIGRDRLTGLEDARGLLAALKPLRDRAASSSRTVSAVHCSLGGPAGGGDPVPERAILAASRRVRWASEPDCRAFHLGGGEFLATSCFSGKHGEVDKMKATSEDLRHRLDSLGESLSDIMPSVRCGSLDPADLPEEPEALQHLIGAVIRGY